MDKPTIFISYSHKDEEWKDRLVGHLGTLFHSGFLNLWDDSHIRAGEDWERQIQEAINDAQVAILLVSANFLTSGFIWREEISHLLQRQVEKGLRILPIIIRPCAWEAVGWLREMHVRPKSGRALATYTTRNVNTELAGIAADIRSLLRSPPTLSPVSPAPIPLDSQKISVTRLPVTGPNLFGRDAELKLLDDAWANALTNIVTFVAWGGIGKSALVNHWLQRMAQDQYRGAECVYAWSFYSQGMSDDRAASADLFIDSALRWFGDIDPSQGSPWDKGERLASLIRRSRTLLLLDGMEPLQHPPNRLGKEEGRMKDPALEVCLRELAAHQPGLCIITTRVQVGDLADYEGGSVVRIDLDHLTPQAGAQILRAQGVAGDEDEMARASAEFGGHSLALTLLGSYLKDVCDGDIRRRYEVGSFGEDLRYGGHARNVMASYEKWLGDGPELAVLRMLGLFDRPADLALIAALRIAPAIPGLTDSLQNLTEREWRHTLARLRRIKLMADNAAQASDVLDTHPLVREYFGAQLKQHLPDAWREANNRLYEHLTRTAKELPDTIDEMAPLFAAVAHGCEAGRHQEAFEDVYLRRIQRGRAFFTHNKLGAFGADLAALLHFFATPSQQPVAGITERDKALVLNIAGFDLRGLGRLPEAARTMEAGLAMDISRGDWENAARAVGNLSGLHLTIGNLSQSLAYAQQSVELADRSGDSFMRIANRTMLADALHQSGRLGESEAAFREAEAMQKEDQPAYPFLYSVQGFQYCDLLLGQGNIMEVRTRGALTIEWGKSGYSLLSIALDNLTLGCALLMQEQQEGTGDFAVAADFLQRAVDGVRQAGRIDYLPYGLLARAALHRLTLDYERARRDLDEALRIAERGSMGLHQADCHLEFARLLLAEGNRDQAHEHITTAKAMIELMGYHRRDKELAELSGLI